MVLEIPRFLKQGDLSKPLSEATKFTYECEFMTAGGKDTVIYKVPGTLTSNVDATKLIRGIRELIPKLYLKSDVIIELPPSKGYGNNPNPFYRAGHNMKLHIKVISIE